jgi:hypothetical protein
VSIARSARYPRVAVVLGVGKKWYIPLLLCRALSTSSAIWWSSAITLQVYKLWTGHFKVSEKMGTLATDASEPFGLLCHRLLVAQVVLSYVWVSLHLSFSQNTLVALHPRRHFPTDSQGTPADLRCLQAATSAYLAHSFASSLMSRWLLHYSPFAVLLRLCSMSILLSYGCVSCFRLLGAMEPDLAALSRSMPIWIVISIGLLVVYFSTQQDISVEGDKDDRRRRLVLRLKCLYTIAGSSLFSVLVIVCIIHWSMIDWGPETWSERVQMGLTHGVQTSVQ